jgi:membrane-associated protease RseP (regulator of RpoE activity)
MATSKGPTYPVLVAIVLGGIVLSLIAGCVGGAVAGYLVYDFRARQKPQALLPPTPTPVPATPEVPQVLPMPRWGWGGALVQYVEPRSPADEAGIQVGDLITAVEGQAVDAANPLDEVLLRFKPGDRVEITVQRGGEERTLRVKLGARPDDESKPYLGVRFTMVGMPFFRRSD